MNKTWAKNEEVEGINWRERINFSACLRVTVAKLWEKIWGGVEEETNFSCLGLGFGEVEGEREHWLIATCIFRWLSMLVSVKSTTLTFTTGAIECFLLLKPT